MCACRDGSQSRKSKAVKHLVGKNQPRGQVSGNTYNVFDVIGNVEMTAVKAA